MSWPASPSPLFHTPCPTSRVVIWAQVWGPGLCHSHLCLLYGCQTYDLHCSPVSSSASYYFWLGSWDSPHPSPHLSGKVCHAQALWRGGAGGEGTACAVVTLSSCSSSSMELFCFLCSLRGMSLQSLQNFAVVYRKLRNVRELIQSSLWSRKVEETFYK